MAFVHLCFILGLVASASCVYMSEDILKRLADLEATEAEHKREISALTNKMAAMEGKEKEMLQRINELTEKCDANREIIETGYDDKTDALKHKRSFNEVHDVVETEVAFYATHTDHDITHLGQNQIIIFNDTVTNVGNAYNAHHGAFTAPVDGTYVFHVTLMGTLHDAASGVYYAFLDVDDVHYSRFYIVPYDQSSHMFVKELKAGSVVSVRNGRVDDGVVGQHYSAFSGFLLYQHSQGPAIIGK